MNIIAKHTLNSVFKNPWQSLMIIITMVIITACAFAALSMTEVFTRTAERFMNANTAYSDILIGDLEAENYEKLAAWEFFDQTDSECIPFAQVPVFVETDNATTRCIINFSSPEKLITASRSIYREKAENNTDLPSIYVSLSCAKDNNIKIGQTLKISTLFQTSDDYFVAGIMENDSVFFGNGGNYMLMTDISQLSEPLRRNALIYLNDNLTDSSFDNALLSVIEYVGVEFPINGYIFGDTGLAVKETAKRSQSILSIALSVMILLMFFILFFAYSVIAKNRINEIIRFKAAGATPSQCTFILLSEATAYALVGCPIGLGIGRLLMKFACAVILDGAEFLISYSAWKYVTALIIGMAAALAACALPSIGIGRKSVRALTDSGVKIAKKPSLILFITATAALLAFFIALPFVSDNAVLPITITLAVAAIVWLAASVPFVIRFFTFAADKLPLKGGAALSTCGLKRNSSIITVATLLSALIAFIWMGSMIVDLVLYTQRPSSIRYSADYAVEFEAWEENDKDLIDVCRGLEGASDVCFYNDLFICGINGVINVPTNDFTAFVLEEGKYMKHFIADLDPAAVEKFDATEHPIVINRKQAGDKGLKVGDKITLVARYQHNNPPRADIPVTFEIVAIDNTTTEYDVEMYIKRSSVERYLPDLHKGVGIFFNGDPNKFSEYRDVIDSFQPGAHLLRTQGGLYTNRTLNDAAKLIKFLMAVFYTVAVLGLFNIIYVINASRVREADEFELIGMTRRQLIASRFTESIIIGLSSMATGLVLCLALNRLQPIFALMLEKYIDAPAFPSKMLYIILIAAAALIALWTLAGAVSNRKRNAGRITREKTN